MKTKDIIREMNDKIRSQSNEIESLILENKQLNILVDTSGADINRLVKALETLVTYRTNVLFDQSSHGKSITDAINGDFDNAVKILEYFGIKL